MPDLDQENSSVERNRDYLNLKIINVKIVINVNGIGNNTFKLRQEQSRSTIQR